MAPICLPTTATRGFLIAAAIDKYVYVTVMRPFTPGIYLKYSQLEHVEDDEVQHPIIREALRSLDFKTPQVEITTLADIPAGTGSVLRAASRPRCSRRSMPTASAICIRGARRACLPHRDRPARRAIGKQDQYIAAFGGITCFTFKQDDTVIASRLQIEYGHAVRSRGQPAALLHRILAQRRRHPQGSGIRRTKQSDADMLSNLHYVKELGYRSKDALETGQPDGFGELMHEHWEHKKRRSGGMSNPQIDEWYELGIRNGAVGGKLVGAGGGGFLMFYADERNRLRHAMRAAGWRKCGSGSISKARRCVLV